MSNIQYLNTTNPELTSNKKPKTSYMELWNLEDRKQKYFEFLEKFDKREDSLLKEDYQIFSHRLHWHEHPFVDEMKEVNDTFEIMWYTLLFSFSNEHWLSFLTLKNQGEQALRERFKKERAARNDLFQIYYPKGTIVKDWLIDGTKKAAKDMHTILKNKDPWTMMHLTKIMALYFKEKQNFRNPNYPCKNFSRYIAMQDNKLADPNSILVGGTGHFDGLHQIFNGPNLMNKIKYEVDDNGVLISKNKHCDVWLSQMKEIMEDDRNVIHTHKFLNNEDKTCFFYKHIAISHSIKKPTKRIPYDWIFPNSFSLRK